MPIFLQQDLFRNKVLTLVEQIEAHHHLLFPEKGPVTCKRLELPASDGKSFAIVGTAQVKGISCADPADVQFTCSLAASVYLRITMLSYWGFLGTCFAVLNYLRCGLWPSCLLAITGKKKLHCDLMAVTRILNANMLADLKNKADSLEIQAILLERVSLSTSFVLPREECTG